MERVAKIFSIPVTTLKDRASGQIDVDTVMSEPTPAYFVGQKVFLSQQITTMSENSYGYSRQETMHLASDNDVHLGIKQKGCRFSLNWLLLV